MKLSVQYFGLLFWVVLSANSFAQKNYGGNIYTNVKIEKGFKDALSDLKYHLEKATDEKFTITHDSTIEQAVKIILVKRRDSTIYANLFSSGEETSLIRSDGKKSLEIIAFSHTGLIHGMYSYMDTLGFRWYQPGDEHTFTPKLKNVQIKIDTVFAPDFLLRTYFGTFGTPRNIYVDKQKKVERDWNIWNKRNRLGGNYSLKGHSWNDFMWKSGWVFKQNPHFMALVKGERVKVATASKFCISDTGFQNLFIAHFSKILQEQIGKSPYAARYIVSVEPSDGDGFCTCSGCKKIGSISNNVFYLANITAKAFQQISPKAFVNLYAYNLHAATPTFALEKNVLVQIIPYKYQSFAKPNDMIKAWKDKAEMLFIYDYYGLPITTLDAPLPKHLSAENYANRIKFWKQSGIKGITLESSYGTGAIGLGLYLFSRLAWNANQDVNEVVDAFYLNCYGKNEAVVKQSKAALSEGNTNTKETLKRAVDILKNAKPYSDKDSFNQNYLTDYKAYMIYLNLLNEYNNASAKNANEKSESLMAYVYGIFHRKVVHPFPVSDHLLYRGKNTKFISTYWNYLKQTQPENKFRTVKQWTDEEINAAFEKLAIGSTIVRE